ncbi:hypothetical protein BDV93DRAFT_547762 [Ceratobasidium sp. AG-I]|nr:hypothetical protein BDV93DRAFT_547762 [Ceratobasidium sp. AG-I]
MSELKPKRHFKYYFEDGNVVFLTSDKTLFRLHKSMLKLHSTFFDDMFEHAHPPTKDSKGNEIPIDGSSDENPIELGGHALATLRDAELESICTVLYEMPLTPASALSVDQATSVLRVSTKYQFEAIHTKVVQMLETALIVPWGRYALAIDCLVDPWILRSYLEICGAVEYHSAELVAVFSRRNEMDKLSNLLRIREDYRTKLLIYSHGTQQFPYPALATPVASACANCLVLLKALLVRILSNGGHNDLDGADATKFPLLEDRIMKGIQPRTQSPINICANCRTKEKAIVNQVLGLNDLESEVKKVMHLAP